MRVLDELAARIERQERTVPGLKPDTQARIVFHTRRAHTRQPTAVVYLHGFTASQAEGAPAHRPHFLRQDVAGVLLADGDDHVRPALRERERHLAPQPAAAAGDEGDLAGEIEQRIGCHCSTPARKLR